MQACNGFIEILHSTVAAVKQQEVPALLEEKKKIRCGMKNQVNKQIEGQVMFRGVG